MKKTISLVIAVLAVGCATPAKTDLSPGRVHTPIGSFSQDEWKGYNEFSLSTP